jgi:putative two-component system response regulator
VGANSYLLRPFKRNELSINLSNALRRRRLEIENRAYRDGPEALVTERTSALRLAVDRLETSRGELTRSREETIKRLSLAIEFRSHETGEHVERIGRNSAFVARHLGFERSRCEMMRLAAALADVFDALTHDRVYRPALPLEEAVGIMARSRGRQFDPDVLDTFVDALARQELAEPRGHAT